VKRSVLALALLALPLPGMAAGRAISLRVLQSTLRAGGSQEARRLCGVTRMTGYILDRRSRDVILVGEADPSAPSLELDDFLVALRNARFVYARKSGRTVYYAPPGCSIDPNPAVLQQLQAVGEKLSVATTPEEKQKCLDEWNAVGSGPQNVRVMGVPFDSRFAKVMVDADYYMKRLVNGTVTLDIPGFESLADTTLNLAKEEMRAGRRSSIPALSLNRFWFCPGDTTYDEDEGVISLESCPVKLLTEEEFLTTAGRVAGKGRPSPLAKRFADSFTAHYREIAAARPIYKELERLFRFAGLARLMCDRKAFSSSGFDPAYLVERYPVENIGVSRAVNGLTSVKEFSEERQIADGMVRSSMLLPSSGGVSMDVRPRPVSAPKTAAVAPKPRAAAAKPGPRTAKAATSTAKAGTAAASPRPAPGRLSQLRKTVLSARGSASSLSWSFPTSR